MNKREVLINQLINDEVIKASQNHPDFQSAHHGYAVILEEAEEAQECFIALKDDLEQLWNVVKDDDFIGQKSIIQNMEANIHDMIKEAVQIAAMLKRYQTFLENTEIVCFKKKA